MFTACLLLRLQPSKVVLLACSKPSRERLQLPCRAPLDVVPHLQGGRGTTLITSTRRRLPLQDKQATLVDASTHCLESRPSELRECCDSSTTSTHTCNPSTSISRACYLAFDSRIHGFLSLVCGAISVPSVPFPVTKQNQTSEQKRRWCRANPEENEEEMHSIDGRQYLFSQQRMHTLQQYDTYRLCFSTEIPPEGEHAQNDACLFCSHRRLCFSEPV